VDEIPDDELISLYRNGDAEAFDVLFGRYYRSVYNFALYMLSNSGRAEDVLQESFLAVARAAKRYEPRGQFRTWLMRIVRNRCLNEIESERVRRIVSTESGSVTLDGPSREPTPLQRLEMAELTAAVTREIGRLPQRQREALVLYAFEEMTYREIAEVLDLPINSVKTLIHRARAALAETLAKEV
jgi:RNA polymerase sigma-70 factor (ECF subfamily)